ncbi:MULTISPECIES: YkgJ family cysteine cluster protein [Pseudomonas]|uniref:YkgJ family cysteine cluster protein n=1 Tax=Pseudomonas TaxID=286 RepID=UPI00226F2641|nr:YkgJ family cysteine cluster protein [Pseudomonas putida]WAC00081.1 YkgJ family cysteine cluster protein [Pseudomonas putida]
MSRFNCDACGLCCQNLAGQPLYSDLDDGTGVCRHYDKGSSRCGIYEQRPLKCRIDDSYDHIYASHMSRAQFHVLNQAACETLKSKRTR